MTYQTVPTVVTGDMWTAAQHNTYIKDNFASLWPYTANGDLAYAASSTSLTKVAAGSQYQILNVSSGVPTWTDQIQKFCILTRSATQTMTIGAISTITFTTETFDNFGFFNPATPTIVTLPTAGLYRIDGSIRYDNITSGTCGFCYKIGATLYYMDTRTWVQSVYTVSNTAHLYQASGSTDLVFQAFHSDNTGSTKFLPKIMITYLGAI